MLFFLYNVASTVNNVGWKLDHFLRRWLVIDALLYKYSEHKETQQFQNLSIHLNNVGVYPRFVF